MWAAGPSLRTSRAQPRALALTHALHAALPQGLTSLVVDQGCGPARWEAFGGFPWDACRLRRLEEVQLRGGWGWMVRHATWRGLLQPKGFYAPGGSGLAGWLAGFVVQGKPGWYRGRHCGRGWGGCTVRWLQAHAQ